MCGIAGFVDLQRAPEEKTLLAFEKALIHRGPDEGRIWRNGPCGLVHRRLRIIDLSPAAAQPMCNEDGQIWVIFNGKIYNFHALRDELCGLGHQFKSRSDTETLIHGYESWGLDLFRRLRGMFAIAIWNCRSEELVLARDRIGKKPLFYVADAQRLIFGSELPVFKHIPGFRPSICKRALQQFAEYGYVHSPNSILEGVRRLPAGHSAVWSRSGFTVQCFASLPSEPPSARPEGGPQEAAAELEKTVREAVVCRLESDVPLGCFLSGGVD